MTGASIEFHHNRRETVKKGTVVPMTVCFLLTAASKIAQEMKCFLVSRQWAEKNTCLCQLRILQRYSLGMVRLAEFKRDGVSNAAYCLACL